METLIIFIAQSCNRVHQQVEALVNLSYFILSVVGSCMQRLLFGELRVPEEQQVKDRFWNFIFYKFIFIFGVLNVQYMDEVLLWVGWFAFLGLLHLITQLCKDRFEYISFSASTPRHLHLRMIVLLSVMLSICIGLLGICVYLSLDQGVNYFLLMSAEVTLVTINASYILVRYAVHLLDTTHEQAWENRAAYVYYIELSFQLAALAVDFAHDLHMLIWGNIFLSMASLVISMRLHCTFQEVKKKLRRHHNYLRIAQQLRGSYPLASSKQLNNYSDPCAICWEILQSARVLPCGHLFHHSCLRSWLEQDTSCPTCRMFLDIEHGKTTPEANAVTATDTNPAALHNNNNTITNHVFHFDGSRYISWLPSVSVELSHSSIPGAPSLIDEPPMLQLSVDVSNPDEIEDTELKDLLFEFRSNTLSTSQEDKKSETTLSQQLSEIDSVPPISTSVEDTNRGISNKRSLRSSLDEPGPSSVLPETPVFNKILLYKERKEQLLSDARRRFLSKHRKEAVH